MALNVHRASTSNTTIPKWNFHVFLSFRGTDTRKSFTDHLYAALCRKGIIAFRDDEELERGEVISKKLLQAIESSLFAIVVLSKNYASSSWCLDELQKIIALRKEGGQQVFPIFYGVDPSNVRHQKGSFAQAFIKHAKRFREDKEKVQKWRDSLTEVANLSGWDSKNQSEAELIEKVVEELWTKLHPKLLLDNDKLVGIDSKINAIDSLLGIGSNDVRFVGIWGMGGVGKTTLARVVYERLRDQFEICCFLSNDREVSERNDGLVQLQRKLLSHLKVKGMVIEDTYEGKKTIQNLCCNKKVLLVLDDISSICQLDNLAESKVWFGAGSRVIITTRNLHLLKSHGVHEIFKVDILNEEESLRLFSNKTFRRDQPKEGYLALSKSVIKYAGGLPLALQVLGSFLCDRSVLQWEDTLKLLKQGPINNDIDKIHKILTISYDGLDKFAKTIFLDIACLFELPVDKDEVTQILALCDLCPIIGIELLVEKSLLSETIRDGHTYIDMHDLIQEMGRSIVSQESPNDPGKRSRLWSPKDIDNVLKNNMGTETIQGIVLPFSSHKAYWNREAFSKMINLRLLMITCNLSLPYGLKCLSSALKVLRWNAYPLEDFSLGTQLDELAYLQMHHSKIKQLWDGRQCFENLKFMDLSYSNYLFKTPNFVGVPNLERLILKDCIGLVDVHSSLGQLKNLLVLNLEGCKSLKFLRGKFEMDSLKEFVLFGCTQVKKLPEFGENMKNLKKLDLQETGVTKLPDSLGFLIGMEVLNLKGCKNLVCLPQTIHNLNHLKILNIFGCSKFSKLSENLNENEALEELDASGTAITEVPSSIGQLEGLKMLSFHRCKGSTSNSSWNFPLPLIKIFQRHSPHKGLMLPPSIFNMKSLIALDLSYCNIDGGFIPDDLGSLSSLQKLNLRGNKFVTLPASVFNIKSLKIFNLSYCNIDERFIPDDLDGLSSLRMLDLSGNNFVNLPAACISKLLRLEQICLDYCPRLQSFPHPSPNLFELVAFECTSLEPLSDQQLSHIYASHFQGDGSYSNRQLFINISESTIPSWFKNKNNITLDMYLDKTHPGSIIIDTPSCKWFGYAFCIVVQPRQKGLRSGNSYWNIACQYDTYIDDIFFEHRGQATAIMFGKDTKFPNKEIRSFLFEFKGEYIHEWEEIQSIKYGWRFIYKEDLEEWGCDLSILEENEEEDEDPDEEEEEDKSEEENKDEREEEMECAVKLRSKGKAILGESTMRALTDDASVRNNGEQKRISNLNFKRKGESKLCMSDHDTELSPTFGPPNKKSKIESGELMMYLKGKGKDPSH